MKAITIQKGEEPHLIWEDVDDPAMGPGEVLVEVRATAVNRADLLQARGLYPPPRGASEILGLEMAGVVVEVPNSASGWRVGDRVCALLPGGGYAERVSVPAELLLPLPDDRGFEWGAAIPEAWYTAFLNLEIEGALQEGESVLIHAGASGVGTAAIQIAKGLGAAVYTTAGGPEKRALCEELGADLALDYHACDFAEEIVSRGAGIDLVLDCVGGSYLDKHLPLLRPMGRIVIIGVMGGGAGSLDLRSLLTKRVRIIGSTLRGRTLDEKQSITLRFKDRVWPHLVSGRFRPVIDKVFPIADAQVAHRYVRENRNRGKVVMTVP
jgi:tumor protein p53-inducible protein 3